MSAEELPGASTGSQSPTRSWPPGCEPRVLTVRSLAGNQIASITVQPAWTIREVMSKIEDSLMLKPGYGLQKLVLADQILKSADTIADLNLADHSEVCAIVGTDSQLGELLAKRITDLYVKLKHMDWKEREAACYELGSMKRDAGVMTRDLAIALKDDVVAVRFAACEALAKVGTAALAATPQLEVCRSDDASALVQMAAADALEAFRRAGYYQLGHGT